MFVFAWILWGIYTLYFVISIILSIIRIVISVEEEEESISINITLGNLIEVATYVFLNIYLFAR